LRRFIGTIVWAIGLGGCVQKQLPTEPVRHHASIPENTFEPFKPPGDAHSVLCATDDAHPNFPNDADRITSSFCQDLVPGGVEPKPTSLRELQKVLGLDFKNLDGGNGIDGNPAFVMMGSSSSLVARYISPLNPRAVVFTPPPADGSKPVGFAILTYARGEHFAEVAVHDPTVDSVNFYIVFFTQACDDQPGGCNYGQLLTPAVEKDWTSVRIYEGGTELGNTILDCLQCHQPDANAPSFLRMQEFTAPYTHFMSMATEGGRALLADFHAAHGNDEDYSVLPAQLIDKSDPAKLKQLIVQAGFDQPNFFDSAKIEAEVKASNPAQPAANIPPGTSATWQAIFDRAAAGQYLLVPYHDVKVTDPDKYASMTDLYKKTMTGELPFDQVPDLRDVLLDQGLEDMGIAAKTGYDGHALIVEMCQQCHNSKLDQTISRANFNVETLDMTSREEKDKAIFRLRISDSDAKKMPPILVRTVTDAQIQAMVDELTK
jgi:hypothetical protein